MMMNTVSTQVCDKICEFIRKVKFAADKGLEGRNHTVYLTEIGTCLYGLLAEHLKKFPVNNAGGCIWTT